MKYDYDKLRAGEILQMPSGTVILLPGSPSEEDIKLDDITHNLARIRRYNGSGPSVLAHTLRCYEIAKSKKLSPRLCLGVLLHDATEAYIGDVPSPIKRHCHGYRSIEAIYWRTIKKAFGLVLGEHEEKLIKEIDRDSRVGELDDNHLKYLTENPKIAIQEFETVFFKELKNDKS